MNINIYNNNITVVEVLGTEIKLISVKHTVNDDFIDRQIEIFTNVSTLINWYSDKRLSLTVNIQYKQDINSIFDALRFISDATIPFRINRINLIDDDGNITDDITSLLAVRNIARSMIKINPITAISNTLCIIDNEY